MDADLTEDGRRVVLTTPRLVVTSWLMDDVDLLHEVHSDPETMRYVRNGRPESREEVHQLLKQYRREDLTQGWTKWRLADQDGRLIGRAGFGGSLGRRGLSYLIRRELWGQGLATEVATALVGWHIRNTHNSPLTAIVEVGNDASVRVLEKTGFQECGPEDYDGIPCRGFIHPLQLPPGQV